jgi:murein L,D-transpeptidase YcbB/YkuD
MIRPDLPRSKPMHKILLSVCSVFLFAFKTYTLKAEVALPQNLDQEETLPIDSARIQNLGNKLLTSFYKRHNNRTVWLNKTDVRKKVLSELNRSGDEGFDPTTFAIDSLNRYEAKIDSISDLQSIDYDIMLTQKLQRYITQLSSGKLNPKWLYRDWDLKPKTIDSNQILEALEKGDSIAAEFEKLKPNHEVYRSLKKALQLLNSYPEDTIDCITVPRIIYKNESDPSLVRIKRKLMYWKDLAPQDSINAVFDQPAFEAVRKFQARHGIRTDGAIGKATVDALNFTKNRRREQIIVNLERWRWFPRDFGKHYIVVNIPDYDLWLVKNNDTIQTKRVVVGVIGRKTAILSSTFNNIILNPTWTVPPTILEEDLLPAATKKSSYFASKNITIYNSKGGVVAPGNWNPEKYKNYRYVQAPGDENSLGNVKFNFPNHYSVYLHDTNHRDYFGRTFRSLSSGCVRVENPLPLAQYMLGEKKWPMEKICDIIYSKKTTVLPLKEKINIHQLYWTAWMDASGVLQFRPDIYNLDDELYEKLRQ